MYVYTCCWIDNNKKRQCVLSVVQARKLFQTSARGMTVLPGVEHVKTIPLIAEVDLTRAGISGSELQDSDYADDDILEAIEDDDASESSANAAQQLDATTSQHQRTLDSFFSRMAREPEGIGLEMEVSGAQGEVTPNRSELY